MALSSCSPYLLLVLAAFLLLGCSLTSRIGQYLRPSQTPTVIAVDKISSTPWPDLTLLPPTLRTPTHTAQPSATITPTPTNTATATNTSTPTLKPPTATFTRTPTQTAIPPSLTPGPNQITAGQHIWTLISIELVPKITVWDVTFPPSQHSGVSAEYQFLRINFECTTGEPLTNLLSGDELLSAETMLLDQSLGTTFVHNPQGYPDIYILDIQDQQYPVTLYGGCWLAAAAPTSEDFTLFFRDLNPLPLVMP
ncbi:hypothetical protein ACFLZW_05375 [Chloroflexota bacterium]